jgi:peptide chain release factor subunit 1
MIAPEGDRSGTSEQRAERMLSSHMLDRIMRFHGGELSVVSVYVALPPGPEARRELRSKADSLLHQIRHLGDDRSLDHDARVSLRDDIERIEEMVSHEILSPGTLAIFSCSRAGLFEVVRLPRAVRDRIMVDETPWIRPMLAVLDEYPRCCIAVVDRESAQFRELYLGELRDAGRLDGRTLRKPAYGGWHGFAERHVSNKVEELAKRHFREVAAALDHLFRRDRYDLLAIGGHEHELPRFMEFLPRRLRERVAGTFSIDLGTATNATIREQAEDVLERHELDEQRRSVAEVLGLAAAGGWAAVGLEECLWAGSAAAVETLLVQEGAIAAGVVCDQSGWLATAGATCPLCGLPTRQTPDVINELVEVVIDEGGSIRHIRAETDLREHLVAASLRFEVPLSGEPPSG